MKTEELIAQAKRILNTKSAISCLTEATEFLRVYAGERSAFYKQISDVDLTNLSGVIYARTQGILEAFIAYVENGLYQGVSIERKAQIDVVSDFIEQAQTLLNSKEVHPAAPTVIIGASLEEFLRNWAEEAGLSLGARKPSLDSYAQILKRSRTH